MRTDHELAQAIWNYMRLGQRPKPSDLILCLGSHDLSVASRAVELYKQRLAPRILFSGGLGRLTKDTFSKSEAEHFADIALEAGVPVADIIIENKSSNTGENITFSYKLLQKRGVEARSIILVQKPYMERRTFATFEAQWPGNRLSNLSVTSPQITFDAYCRSIPEREVINIMVGDLQRIREYPKLGFQTEQHIPADVWAAYEQLVARGYTQQLLES